MDNLQRARPIEVVLEKLLDAGTAPRLTLHLRNGRNVVGWLLDMSREEGVILMRNSDADGDSTYVALAAVDALTLHDADLHESARAVASAALRETFGAPFPLTVDEAAAASPAVGSLMARFADALRGKRGQGGARVRGVHFGVAREPGFRINEDGVLVLEAAEAGDFSDEALQAAIAVLL
jgi:hypothetical protein